MNFNFLPKVHSSNHATDSDARWLKKCGLSQDSALQASVFRNVHFLGGHSPPKPPKCRPQCANPSQIVKVE